MSFWIVDSGASNYDWRCHNFQNYTPCSRNYIVHIVDGSLSKVVGIGSIVISKDLTRNSVLLVPNLDCNMLSISKLTQEKNCVTKFFSYHCVF